MPGRPGDAAARVGRSAAHVEAGDRRAIIGAPQHWAGGEELVERQRPVKDVAADPPPASDAALTALLERALAFVGTLPPKPAKGKAKPERA